MDKYILGKKIRELRTAKGVSQEELGKALGRSHAAVSDMERGVTEITVKDLYRIAEILSVPITEFIKEQEQSQHVSFSHNRYDKNMTPQEKATSDKVNDDFETHVRNLIKNKQ